MENNSNGQGMAKKPQESTEVVMIKVIIIFAIALIPVAFMLFDISKRIGLLTSATKTPQTQSIGKEYDFDVQVPANVSGDISQVPQEKIDSLFNNLK